MNLGFGMGNLIKQLIRLLKKKTAEAVFQTSGDNCNAVKAVSACAIMRPPYCPQIRPLKQRENPKIINNNYA
jgi:hypothetical protein